MNTTAVTVNQAYQKMLARKARQDELERSYLGRDRNSTLYQAELCGLTKELVRLMGDAEYNAWFTGLFPPAKDDGLTFTWADKRDAAEKKLAEIKKAQAQP